MHYLKLYLQIFYNPYRAGATLADSNVSLKFALAALISVALIFETIDFALFLVDPHWNKVGIFIGEQVIVIRPWWREILGILANTVFSTGVLIIFSWLLYKVLNFLNAKNIGLSHIIWWHTIALSIVLVLHIFNFSLLFGREFLPLTKPYTLYVYLGAVGYSLYLCLTTLAAFVQWSRFKTFVALVIYGFVSYLMITLLNLALKFLFSLNLVPY